MSFQDFKKGPSNRKGGSAAAANYQPNSSGNSSSSPWSIASGGVISSSGDSSSSTSRISDFLTQYQRNVGILEKIAQQCVARGTTPSMLQELEQQYKVQWDVLKQLEQKVRELLQAQRAKTNTIDETTKQTLLKLERDFNRVQEVALSTNSKIQKAQKQWQQRGSVAQSMSQSNSSGASVLHQEQERIQAQLQQDRLHEEIMREREAEISIINKGMHQVNEIYKDLAHIVGSQQEQVDQIETQMEDARGNAESGLEQVQKANERYNNSQCTIS